MNPRTMVTMIAGALLLSAASLTADDATAARAGADPGVTTVSSLAELRSFGTRDHVQVRLKPGVYHVDGLLRPTNEILAEISGYAFEQGFVMRGNGEGVPPASDGRIPRDEMVSLSEDGIRLYDQFDGYPTGVTTIRRCTVERMRRGICTGLGPAADQVIDCRVTGCVAAGFNAGGGDVLTGCAADAKYAEALSLPYSGSRGTSVHLEILDSRGGLANSLLAKLNGRDHEVTITTADPAFVPPGFSIELAGSRGYLGFRGGARAAHVTLYNRTPAGVIIFPDAADSAISGAGPVDNRSTHPQHFSPR